jgi:radical SAM superfamily enzyme YgiQ (UPF0313 family)
MKTLLVAVNAKYIHTSLSVRCLAAYVKSEDVEFAEYTINERAEDILRSVYLKKADAVLFSCYIWNIEICLAVAQMLKKVAPHTKIIFGGPEVSYDDEYIEKYDFLDAVMRGEGEETFKEWLEKGEDIRGMTYRSGGKIVRNPDREPIHDITSIPFPYTDEDIEKNKGKLIYYESSRGCPFRCSYCLSSTAHNVRFRDLETVKRELMFFVRHKVRIVKFVDRTFNADKKRTYELVKFLIENAGVTTFHFEVAADLIDDKLIELFALAPDGLFQLEIGVQSTNDDTISAIDRKTDFELIKTAVRRIHEAGGVHMHLDLIAGLPHEDIASFQKSFDDVFDLRPHVLQLGFLKLLRGTKIRAEEEKYGYKYNSHAPYEVLKNDFVTYDDILLLKGIEETFERYYNSGVFKNAMEYLLKRYKSPFELFRDMWLFYSENEYNLSGQSRDKLYEILSRFCADELFCDILKLDYFTYNKGANTPKWANSEYNRELLKQRFEILTEEFISENLAEYNNIPPKEIIKSLNFEEFDYDVLGSCEKKKNIIIFDNKYNRRIRVCKDLKQ